MEEKAVEEIIKLIALGSWDLFGTFEDAACHFFKNKDKKFWDFFLEDLDYVIN